MKRIISEQRRINLINFIEDALEEREFNEWENGFLEDIQKKLRADEDLSINQYNTLLDILPDMI